MTLEELAENLYKNHSKKQFKYFFSEHSQYPILEATPPLFKDLPEEVRGVWFEYAKLQLMPTEFVEDFKKREK